MKRILGVFAALVVASPHVLSAQVLPRDEFLTWARAHARPIPANGQAEGSWEGMRDIIGDARVVALGEPLHGFRGPLETRNQLCRYLVEKLGFTAVALETGLSASKQLSDYVAGRANVPDAALARAFSWGFGNFEENLELLRWLRSHNATRPPGQRVRFYGVDLTGDVLPNASQALEPVFAYLDRVDPGLAASARKDFAALKPHLGGEAYPKLPRADKDRVTARIADLVASLRVGRVAYAAAGSPDDYEWALRQAINAVQLDAQARSMPEDLLRQMQANQVEQTLVDAVNLREAAIADNLAWALDREGPRGRLLFFAHNTHVQRHAEFANLDERAAPMSRLAPSVNPAGLYLGSMVGREMVVIGTYFGAVEGLPEEKETLGMDPNGVEALLGGYDVEAYAVDLRSLPGDGLLRDWMRAGQPARGGLSGERTHRLAPARSFDAVIYVRRVVPTPFLRNLLKPM
jgi:erythromycin esterase